MYLSVLEIGPPTLPRTLMPGPESDPNVTLPSNTSLGFFVLMMIAPPMALRPKTAPWGPFTTSMVSMSKSSWLNCEGFAICTPSMSTATEGSLLRACEMPRTVTNEVPWFWVCTRLMFGVSATKSCGRSMPAALISAAVKALIAPGTSSNGSSRRRGVTVIVSAAATVSDTSTGMTPEPLTMMSSRFIGTNPVNVNVRV